MIDHYWLFKDIDYKLEAKACNRCHDISMMVYESQNIVTLNVKDVFWNMFKNNATNRLNNSKLYGKSLL